MTFCCNFDNHFFYTRQHLENEEIKLMKLAETSSLQSEIKFDVLELKRRKSYSDPIPRHTILFPIEHDIEESICDARICREMR